MPRKDGLTGTLHHLEFLSRLEKAAGSTAVVSVGLVDVDDFASLNESEGTETCDGILTATAAALRETLPAKTAIGRMGGDEFGVLLRNTEPEDAFLLLEAVRAAVTTAGEPVPFSVSIGVASLPRDGKSGPGILRMADAAVYRAKSLGRNRVCLPPDERMVAKTAHFTQTQLQRLSRLSKEREIGEAELLREAVDEYLFRQSW